MPIWRLLECDFKLYLVNPYAIKQLPGRKLGQYIEELEMYRRHKAHCLLMMKEICKECYQKELENLQTIPGVGEQAATQIIAEMGVDMSMFLTANMLVGWAGLKPRNDESNGKFKSRK